MKIRTDSEFQEYLDSHFAWRVQEIDRLKTAVKRASSGNQKTLMRAGVPLLYAHWEGFVKVGAEGILCFVSAAGRRYRELAPCFATHGLAREIDLLISSKKGDLRTATVSFLMTRLDDVARFDWKGRANAGGNLNYERFCGIAGAIGVDTSRYDSRSKFVDKSLVDRRNSIAHGEWIGLDSDSFADVADGVLLLLRWFKTDLENTIAQRLYLNTPSGVLGSP